MNFTLCEQLELLKLRRLIKCFITITILSKFVVMSYASFRMSGLRHLINISIIYALGLGAAWATHTYFHWPDIFNEDGPIETLSAILYSTAVMIYFKRGFAKKLGFFPVILLLLFWDRELSFMHHIIASDLGWPKLYRLSAKIVLALATLYTFYFIVRKKAHLLFMARAQPLLVLAIVLFICLSIEFSYEGEKMQLLWLEETTELLFGLLLNYALIVIKLPSPTLSNG